MSALTENKRPHFRPPSRPKPKTAPASARSVSPARLAAFQILERVGQGKGHSDDLLHSHAMSGLSQEDRNLATTLVLGTLRWQIALDARIAPLLQRPDIVPAGPVRIALRLGAFQLLHLDRIPAHAALNESVELTRSAGQPHASGMVNAVLRKLAAAPASGKRLHESAAVLAGRLGHPSWLVERWVANFGRDTATAVCEFDQHEPACGQLFASSTAQVEDGSVKPLPQMDDGSRLVAEIAAASVPSAQRIWDCCAAPGGKTLILARRHPYAELLATDVNQRRLLALTGRLRRDAPESKTKTLLSEAQALPQSEGAFDLVLCDVPCSGTGTLARNPEIRHHLRPSDLPRQAERQQAILTAALARLAPGGTLVYSTCSLEPEENEQVVDKVLGQVGATYQQTSIEPFVQALRSEGIVAAGADLSKSIRDGNLRTLPGYNFQGDGFFATLITRA